MVLRGLQTWLQRLYDVESDHDVYDFLITDRRALLRMGTPENRAVSENGSRLEEELLLAESADGVAGVSLYLDAELLERLESANPMHALNEENLVDYCTALEGVSHFVYATWRLSRDLPVSLLELETQAEVDKYAVTVFLTGSQQQEALGGGYPAQVHTRLFDHVSFDERLLPHQYQRYHTAHRCAASFCRDLERRFVNRGVARVEGLVRELRKFYRLGSAQKLRYALS